MQLCGQLQPSRRRAPRIPICLKRQLARWLAHQAPALPAPPPPPSSILHHREPKPLSSSIPSSRAPHRGFLSL